MNKPGIPIVYQKYFENSKEEIQMAKKHMKNAHHL
jgi:cellobiose-specific phosphotransferase system component IIA